MSSGADDRLAIGEAAAYLGVAPHTLRAWTREGRVAATRTAGGHRRYLRSELDAFLALESSGDAGPTNEASLLARVGTLFESLQPGEVVRGIAAILRESVTCSSVAVSTYDAGADEVVTILDTSGGATHAEDPARFLLEDFPATARALHDQVVVLTNASAPDADPAEVALNAAAGHVSALMVPLVFHGDSVGLVELYDDREERIYRAEELALVRALAGHAAAALQNARRVEQLRQQNADQQLLLATGRAISSSVDLAETLETIARLLTETLHTAWADIYLFHPQQDALEVAAFYQIEATAPADDWIGSFQPVDGWPEWRECILSQQPVHWYRDEVELTPEQVEGLDPWGEQATLTVALVSQGRTIGLLDVAEHRFKRLFTEEDVRLTMAIADQAAIAISNARLFAETQRRNAELATLVRSAEALAATTSPEDTLSALLRVLSDAIPVELVEFCEFRTTERTIVTLAREARKALAPGESIDVYDVDRSPEIAAALDERRSVTLYVDDEAVSPATREEMHGLSEQAVLAIPMLSRGDVVGLVYLASHSPGRRFGDDEVRLASAIAAQSATAIENARAHAREIAESERLATLNRRLNALVAVSGQIRGLMDERELLTVLGHVMSETLRFREWAVYLYEPEQRVYRVAADHSFDPELEAAAGSRTIPARIIDGLLAVSTILSNSYFIDHRRHSWTDEENAAMPGADLGDRAEDEWQTDDSLLIPMIGTSDEVIGYLEAFDPEDRQRPTEELVRLLEVFAAKAAASIELVRLHDQLEQQATTDGLTGLYNHRYLDDAIEHEVASALRYGTEVSVLMIDIDDFKPFNDTFGHPQGDKLLRRIAEILTSETREQVDIVCRYGGEEFCIVLPNTPVGGAESVAGRLRDSVSQGTRAAEEVAEAIRQATEAETFEGFPTRRDAHITLSVGIACLPKHGRSAAEVLSCADKALYMSKRSGKNRVSVFGE
jgi:diguanylate cyclase (GGDEF)-like protein/excisionase family DNA binding protein